MIIFHDPRDAFSRAFMDSIPQGWYQIVDWTNAEQSLPYQTGTIRAFPSLLLTTDDGSYGGVDCQLSSVVSYQDALQISTAMQTVPTYDESGDQIGTQSVPVDSRVIPLDWYSPDTIQPPPQTPVKGAPSPNQPLDGGSNLGAI